MRFFLEPAAAKRVKAASMADVSTTWGLNRPPIHRTISRWCSCVGSWNDSKNAS
jgi:hypothetical protein